MIDIVVVNETKFLGLKPLMIILNFSTKKLNIYLFVLKILKHVPDKATATVAAYYDMFESHLWFDLAVWGRTYAGNINRVFNFRKRIAARTLNDLYPSRKIAEMTLGT